MPSLEGQGTVPAILSVRISRRGIAWPRWPMQCRHPSRRRHARPPPSHPARRTVPTPPLSAPALCQNQADVPDFVSINRTPLLRPCIATDGPRSNHGRRARAQRIIQRWRVSDCSTHARTQAKRSACALRSRGDFSNHFCSIAKRPHLCIVRARVERPRPNSAMLGLGSLSGPRPQARSLGSSHSSFHGMQSAFQRLTISKPTVHTPPAPLQIEGDGRWRPGWCRGARSLAAPVIVSHCARHSHDDLLTPILTPALRSLEKVRPDGQKGQQRLPHHIFTQAQPVPPGA